MNMLFKILTFCIICVSMSGCMESGEQNADGFRIGETKEFDFVFDSGDIEMELAGTITQNSERYYIDCEFETIIDNYVYTGKSEGMTNNVRMTMYGAAGLADVSYNNCEGTPLLEAMISNAK